MEDGWGVGYEEIRVVNSWVSFLMVGEWGESDRAEVRRASSLVGNLTINSCASCRVLLVK